MTRFRVRAWVGPAWVGQYAERLRARFPGAVIEGTEHVIVDLEAKDDVIAEDLIAALTDSRQVEATEVA